MKMRFAVCAVMCAVLACSAASAEGNRQGNDFGGKSGQIQQSGRMEQMNGSAQNNQPQGAPNGNAQNNQNGHGMQKPNGQKDMPSRISMKKLLEDGVIDEDTYNAIESYLKENAPELPDSDNSAQDSQQPPEKPDGDDNSAQDGQQPPEKPDGDDNSAQDGQQPPEKPDSDDNSAQDGQQPPEKPDGDDSSAPEMPDDLGGGLDETLLKNLLDSGVITQEQYDTLLNLLSSAEAA